MSSDPIWIPFASSFLVIHIPGMLSQDNSPILFDLAISGAVLWLVNHSYCVYSRRLRYNGKMEMHILRFRPTSIAGIKKVCWFNDLSFNRN